MSNDDYPPVVSVASCSSYEPQVLTAAIRRILDPLGGMKAFVSPGQTVLLKPNFLAPSPRETVVCTDPAFIVAVAQLVTECGGKVKIGDSPALTRAQAVASKLGLTDIAEQNGWEIIDFRERVTRSGTTFHSIELAAECLEADVLINLPKFKTHSMMEMSTGIKNLFGCVVGKRKAAYHLHVKDSREMFARLMIDICDAVCPTLTILDAVVGMQGDGPRGGELCRLNFVAASSECWAIDLASAWVAGYSVAEIPILKEISARMAKKGRALDIRVVGDDLAGFYVADFKRPKSFPLSFRLPDWLRRPLRSLVLPAPKVNAAKCVGCGNCAEACPADVITVRDGKASINNKNCIHCFCCAEVCPVKAIDISSPTLPFFRH